MSTEQSTEQPTEMSTEIPADNLTKESAAPPTIAEFNKVSSAQSARLGLIIITLLWIAAAATALLETAAGNNESPWILMAVPVAVLATGSLFIKLGTLSSALLSIALHLTMSIGMHLVGVATNAADILGIVAILGLLVFVGPATAIVGALVYMTASGLIHTQIQQQDTWLVLLAASRTLGVLLTLATCPVILHRGNELRARTKLNAALNLRQTKTAQSALLRTLTLEFDAPLSNARLLLSDTMVSNETREDLYRIALQLTALLEEVERQISDSTLEQSTVTETDLRGLIYDVERQMRPLLAARSIQFKLERLDLPVDHYRIDAQRLRALLLLFPRAVYSVHTVSRQLSLAIRAVAMRDDYHQLEISFAVDKTLYTPEQLRLMLAPASDGIEGRENLIGEPNAHAQTSSSKKLSRSGVGQAAEWVVRMGGQMSVEGEGESGIRVRILLPIEPSENLSSSTILPTDLILDGRKVLLVDDDATHRLAASRVLRGYFGSKILTAASGAEALDRIAEHPDLALVISDFFMPDMNGAELRQQAQEHYPALPFLLLSAGLLQREVVKLEAENAHVLMKPLTDEKLRSLLANGTLAIPPLPDSTGADNIVDSSSTSLA